MLTACVVGALTGGVAVALAEAIHTLQRLAIGSGGRPAEVLGGLPPWQVVLVPTVGGLVVGCIGALASEVRGHGVPDVMEAVALRGGRLPRRAALTKWLATAVTIGSGGSVGREGPIVHIGASVGSAVGQLLRLPANRLRTLTAAGAAGGIAAAFNAPIAGAFFALEVIARNFATHTFAPVVLCAVIATGVSRQYFGAAPAFEVPPLALGGIAEVPLATLLGIFCGFVSLAFMMLLRGLERAFERLPAPVILKPALGGLALGGLLLLAPDLYGAGHETMGAMLRGDLAWQTLVLLLLLKPIATSTTLRSPSPSPIVLISGKSKHRSGALVGKTPPTRCGTFKSSMARRRERVCRKASSTTEKIMKSGLNDSTFARKSPSMSSLIEIPRSSVMLNSRTFKSFARFSELEFSSET